MRSPCDSVAVEYRRLGSNRAMPRHERDFRCRKQTKRSNIWQQGKRAIVSSSKTICNVVAGWGLRVRRERRPVGPVAPRPYVYSEVFDLNPTSDTGIGRLVAQVFPSHKAA